MSTAILNLFKKLSLEFVLSESVCIVVVTEFKWHHLAAKPARSRYPRAQEKRFDFLFQFTVQNAILYYKLSAHYEHVRLLLFQ